MTDIDNDVRYVIIGNTHSGWEVYDRLARKVLFAGSLRDCQRYVTLASKQMNLI
jgi:hypothetical protein